MKELPQAYPLRFGTVDEGLRFIKDYTSGLTSDGIPRGIVPFKEESGKAMVNPEYQNAECEIRILTDGKQGYAACVKLR